MNKITLFGFLALGILASAQVSAAQDQLQTQMARKHAAQAQAHTTTAKSGAAAGSAKKASDKSS